MAREIERKFLVVGTAWKTGAAGIRFRQGYLSTAKERTVRVRLEGRRAVLTIKGLAVGVSRPEFEYAIPAEDAVRLLDELCQRPLIEKTRYRIPVEGLVWEVDEFHGENDGLIVAEVELTSTDQAFTRPSWVGREVSDDPRYFNANLVAHPYGTWDGAQPQATS
jgi:CYTH domain-containing protein